jgi:hypothetical protein
LAVNRFNPLKPVLDAITANRDINRQKDEARRSDERQAMRHEEAMAREGREGAQLERGYALEVAEFLIKADAMRFSQKMALLDRMQAGRRSALAEELPHAAAHGYRRRRTSQRGRDAWAGWQSRRTRSR